MLYYKDGKLALWVITLFICVNSYSSDSIPKQYFIEAKAHYGFILPHAKDLVKWKTTNPYGVQVDWGWYRDEIKSQEQCNCFAKAGFSFIWFNLGEPEILGHALNTVIYYEPLLSYKRKLFLSLKAGIGPSFLTKVYNENTNPENEFFASHLSYLLLMHLNFNYRINSQLKLNVSACYNHISNGGQKQPNRGMNFPTLNMGFGYNFEPKYFSKPFDNEEENYFLEKIRYDISFYATGKSIGNSYGYESMVLPVYGLYTSASKRVSRISAIITGAEWVSDGYVKELLRRKEDKTDYKNAAVFIGHELLIGKGYFLSIVLLLCLQSL